jgi:hypothetical protein
MTGWHVRGIDVWGAVYVSQTLVSDWRRVIVFL